MVNPGRSKGGEKRGHTEISDGDGNGEKMKKEKKSTHGDRGSSSEACVLNWGVVDGYIKHPTVGFIMDPSFYDNRNRIKLDTEPPYMFDPEIDGPICHATQICVHKNRDCFEIRARMATLAHLHHKISLKDAAFVWSIGERSVAKRTHELKDKMNIRFLITPDRAERKGKKQAKRK